MLTMTIHQQVDCMH